MWQGRLLVCHMISKNHVIQGSCNSMGRTLSSYVTPLQLFTTLGTVVAEIFSICQMISQDNVTKEQSSIMDRSHLKLVTIQVPILKLKENAQHVQKGHPTHSIKLNSLPSCTYLFMIYVATFTIFYFLLEILNPPPLCWQRE